MRGRSKVMLVLVAAVAVAGALWIASAPRGLDPAAIAAAGPGNAAAGERIFWTAGCASCHAAPNAKGDDLLRLSGGVELATDFGTFVAPNISSDPVAGIGSWSLSDFANAVMRGVSPDGTHYYPAFPYTSYARMTLADTADLYAFMRTLPAVATEAPASQVLFPFNLRSGLGLWKLAFMHTESIATLPADADAAVVRGRYLVEGPGHCGECHTPRNAVGGPDYSRWLAGADNPDGSGVVPNITPGAADFADWSVNDIAYYLESGFTPDFDSVGGSMVDVQENIAKLPASDREAIAAYLKAVAPQANGYIDTES